MSAKKRGVIFGRPRKKLPTNFEAVANRVIKQEISVKKALEETGMARASFYRAMRSFEKERLNKK